MREIKERATDTVAVGGGSPPTRQSPLTPQACSIDGYRANRHLAGATPPLGNRKYDPLYELCEELGLPVVFHTGGAGLDEYVRAGYQEMIESHT